eukprot:8411699-Alexandrium_andersonii.AAC.1
MTARCARACVRACARACVCPSIRPSARSVGPSTRPWLGLVRNVALRRGKGPVQRRPCAKNGSALGCPESGVGWRRRGNVADYSQRKRWGE